MSLDFALLDENGAVERSARLGMDAHERLIGHCRAASCQLLSRAHDYYEEVIYAPEEVPLLLNEISVLCARPDLDADLDDWLRSLAELATIAIGRHSGLEVIPD